MTVNEWVVLLETVKSALDNELGCRVGPCLLFAASVHRRAPAPAFYRSVTNSCAQRASRVHSSGTGGVRTCEPQQTAAPRLVLVFHSELDHDLAGA